MKSAFFRRLTAITAAATFFSFTACSATLDKSQLTAKNGSTESTQADVVEIAYDPNSPTFVVAVEPFIFTPTAAPQDNVTTINFRRGGEQLAAQLTTVLANAGNLSVVDSGLSKQNNGTYTASLQSGEVGPFIIRATVTELVENAESSRSKKGASLGWLGIVGAVAGAVAGKPALAWTGAGIAAANPSYNDDESMRKGMVAIDFRIVDGRTSRIVGAFKASGNFTSASAKTGFSIFGIGSEEHKFAQSALSQAIRIALNDAVVKIDNALKTRVA